MPGESRTLVFSVHVRDAVARTLRHGMTALDRTLVLQVEGGNTIFISVTANCHPTGIGRRSCVAVCCSVLQCVEVCCSVLQCVVVCCSAWQCVAVRCSALQCVAVCCSGMQCVVERCNVLQRVAAPQPSTTLHL